MEIDEREFDRLHTEIVTLRRCLNMVLKASIDVLDFLPQLNPENPQVNALREAVKQCTGLSS